MDDTEDRDEIEFQRYLTLRRISHIARYGTVDGVEFDLRHDALDPRQWGMWIIANEGKFRERCDGQPFVWFPWYGVFDKDALTKKLAESVPPPSNKRQLERELKENTPEITVVAGDKIVIDRVEILQLDQPFKHRHDAEVRLAFLKVVHSDGRTAKIKTPIRLLGHTAFQLRGSHHNILGKITARIFEHHGIVSLDDPKVREIVEGNSFAGASLLYLWMLVDRNKHALSLVDDSDSDHPQYWDAFATHQTIEEALLVGYYWANAEAQLKMEPLARSGMEALRGAKKAGIESGNRRRAKAEKTWKAHAFELAQQARKDDPSLSQHRLADEITFKWKLETPPPGHTTLTNFISELEKAGRLPRRVRDLSSNERRSVD